MKHTIKGVREQFKAQGKFHTPPELVEYLHDLVNPNPRDVYDPTCGAGALLAAFPAETPKYGQDIDQEALDDANQLPNFHGHLGDVLTDPAWVDHKFHAIVANPPFSIKWDPNPADLRWWTAPTVPTAQRSDFAFILHILHMLADDGTAAILCFPGVLYRQGREKTLRQYLLDLNVIEEVHAIPGHHFTDTSIATGLLVLKKDRKPGDPVTMRVVEHDLERQVTVEEIADNDYTLSATGYVTLPEPEKPPVDPWELEQLARRNACNQLRKELRFSQAIATIESWPFQPFLNDLNNVITEFKETA